MARRKRWIKFPKAPILGRNQKFCALFITNRYTFFYSFAHSSTIFFLDIRITIDKQNCGRWGSEIGIQPRVAFLSILDLSCQLVCSSDVRPPLSLQTSIASCRCTFQLKSRSDTTCWRLQKAACFRFQHIRTLPLSPPFMPFKGSNKRSRDLAVSPVTSSFLSGTDAPGSDPCVERAGLSREEGVRALHSRHQPGHAHCRRLPHIRPGTCFCPASRPVSFLKESLQVCTFLSCK